jgi:tetratricopeptide (TPR) repeat protein
MDTPMGRYWERQSALQRGIVALSESKPSEAREHLTRALACRPSRGPAEDSVERASIQLRLGECLIALEQFDEAGPVLGRAIESGVASGDADGRYLAAAAAWVGACATADDPEERRRFLDTTLRLGRLSGLKAGRELAEKAEAALKEMFS